MNEIEEQLSAARRTFNAVTTDYNDAIKMFPSNLLAGLIGYRLRPLLKCLLSKERTLTRLNYLLANGESTILFCWSPFLFPPGDYASFTDI